MNQQEITDQLRTVFTEEGVELWWSHPRTAYNGKSPREAWADGREEEVIYGMRTVVIDDGDLPTPMMDWASIDPINGDCLYWCRFDKRYQIEVHRHDDYHGVLLIFDHNRNNALIFRMRVGLVYGAIFGPDVEDIQLWEATVEQFIDSLYRPHSLHAGPRSPKQPR